MLGWTWQTNGAKVGIELWTSCREQGQDTKFVGDREWWQLIENRLWFVWREQEESTVGWPLIFENIPVNLSSCTVCVLM